VNGRMKLLALRKRAAEASEQSKKAISRKRKKRAEREAARERDAFKLDPDAYRDREPERTRVVNSSDVWQWFEAHLKERHGDTFVVDGWTIPQKTLAKKLLKAYGEELVKKAVDYLFSIWDDMVKDSQGKLSGEPTINFLWATRERVLADVQTGRKRKRKRHRDHGEYIGKTKTPRIGW